MSNQEERPQRVVSSSSPPPQRSDPDGTADQNEETVSDEQHKQDEGDASGFVSLHLKAYTDDLRDRDETIRGRFCDPVLHDFPDPEQARSLRGHFYDRLTLQQIIKISEDAANSIDTGRGCPENMNFDVHRDGIHPIHGVRELIPLPELRHARDTPLSGDELKEFCDDVAEYKSRGALREAYEYFRRHTRYGNVSSCSIDHCNSSPKIFISKISPDTGTARKGLDDRQKQRLCHDCQPRLPDLEAPRIIPASTGRSSVDVSPSRLELSANSANRPPTSRGDQIVFPARPVSSADSARQHRGQVLATTTRLVRCGDTFMDVEVSPDRTGPTEPAGNTTIQPWLCNGYPLPSQTPAHYILRTSSLPSVPPSSRPTVRAEANAPKRCIRACPAFLIPFSLFLLTVLAILLFARFYPQ